jgi:hypothetical protein
MPCTIQPLSLDNSAIRFMIRSRSHSVARAIAVKTCCDYIGRRISATITSSMKVLSRAFQALSLGGIDAERPREFFGRRLPHGESAIEAMSGLSLKCRMAATSQ